MKNMRDELNTLSHSSRWNDVLSSKIGFITHDPKFHKVADYNIIEAQVQEKSIKFIVLFRPNMHFCSCPCIIFLAKVFDSNF